MRKLPISHIINNAAALKTEAEKVQYLQQHYSTALTTVLQFALDKRAKWDLPEGDPPYKPSDLTFDNEGMMYSEARRLYLFLEGGNPKLTKLGTSVGKAQMSSGKVLFPHHKSRTTMMHTTIFGNKKVKVMVIPDICSIEFGRGVGYEIIERIPPVEIGEISATKIREEMRKEGKL